MVQGERNKCDVKVLSDLHSGGWDGGLGLWAGGASGLPGLFVEGGVEDGAVWLLAGGQLLLRQGGLRAWRRGQGQGDLFTTPRPIFGLVPTL